MIFKKSWVSLLSGTMLCTWILPCAVAGKEEHEAPIISDTQSADVSPTSLYPELSILQGKGFEFSSTAASAFKNDFKLDMFYKNNMDLILREGLEFILNNNSTSFMDSKEALNKNILQNSLLRECILSTAKYLRLSTSATEDRQTELLNRLSGIQKLIEIDESIPRDNGFYRFVSAMKNAYQTAVSRRVAAQILADSRETVEGKMSSENVSRSAGVGVSVIPEGITMGISVGAQSSENSSEKSFYRIDNSGNIRLSIGAGLKKYFSAEAGASLGVAHALIFYSLEQFLDTYTKEGKISSLELREPTIKEITKSRKSMQSSEKKLLANMQGSVEWYLKMSGIVPQNTNFEWPKITFASCADKQTTVSLSGDASAVAKCFASIGMNVSSGTERAYLSVNHPLLALIYDDCSSSEYVKNAAQIAGFLKQNKCKKYNDIKEHEELYSKESETPQEAAALSFVISSVIGDVRHYTSALSAMADKNSDKEQINSARTLKHQIESQWINKSKISRIGKGRSEMLKAFITVASYLREFARTKDEIGIFKQLYTEIEHLAKMQVFAKKSSSQTADFSTSRKCDTYFAKGKMDLIIPLVGTTAVDIEYTSNKSDADFDTSNDMALKMQVPMFGDGVLGTHIIKDKFAEIMKKLSEDDKNPAAPMIKESLSLIGGNFNNILKDFGIDVVLSVPGTFSVEKYMNMNFYLTQINKAENSESIRALPGSSAVINSSKDKWALKLVKRIDSVVSKLNIGISDAVSLKASDAIGRATAKIGPDTLTFITSRYNVFETGFQDKSDKNNTLWAGFKQGQEPQLKKMFKNMASDNKNVKYELQCMYNALKNNLDAASSLNESQKNKLSSKADTCFEEFLTACTAFSKTKSQKDYEKASGYFDKVLKLNYDYIYLPELNRAHAIKV